VVILYLFWGQVGRFGLHFRMFLDLFGTICWPIWDNFGKLGDPLSRYPVVVTQVIHLRSPCLLLAVTSKTVQ
jgi:hypothetical protein